MVGVNEVLRQFRSLGVRPSILARPEIVELGNILVPGEQLKHVVFGWYENGFALLVCTDHRVLLIDKKLFFFKLEDLRYDRISELRYMNRLLDATLVMSYAGMKLVFKSWNQAGLRRLMEYVQEAIMKMSQFQWAMQEEAFNNSNAATAPRHLEPVEATAQAYEVQTYPEDLMQRSKLDLGLQRNPYAPTTKHMRRRVPVANFSYGGRY